MSLEQHLGAAFAAHHPDDAARVLEGLSAEDDATLLAALPPEDAAPVLARMGAVSAAGCVGALGPDAAAALLSNLSVTSIAAVLRQMPNAQPVLRQLPEGTRDAAARLLRFAEGTAGAMADPTVLIVSDDVSAGEAHKLLRRTPERVTLDLYVVDRGNHLVGALDLRALLGASASEPITSIMRRDPATLPAGADLSTVAALPGWAEHDALPVVDDTGILLGVLRHRTLRRMVRDTAGGVLTPLVSLAELYWTGFSRVMFGFGEAAVTAGPRPPQGKEVLDVT